MDPRFDTLCLLMDEIGPRARDFTIVMQDGLASWALEYEGGRRVHVSAREEPPRVEIMVEVCAFPQCGPAEVLKMLMMFNFMSADTAGARMALCSPDDTVYVVRDLPLDEAQGLRLESAIARLASIASLWADFVDNAANGSARSPRDNASVGQFA
ncbi:type III secretion system chaperone [Ramlibacter sp.]|uniref:type III secretion system chaperone n=1 Tax=Ramlibacter sp. TaxID=1917967 RepID=UPI003D09DC9E